MNLTLETAGDTSCKLLERAAGPGTAITNTIPVPVAKDDLLNALRDLLADGERTEGEYDPLVLVKMRDHLRITSGVLNVQIKWVDCFALILAE